VGEWLLPTNVNHYLVGAMSTVDTNLPAVFDNITANLENLANITSNLNAQVQANSNILSSISQAVIDTDESTLQWCFITRDLKDAKLFGAIDIWTVKPTCLKLQEDRVWVSSDPDDMFAGRVAQLLISEAREVEIPVPDDHRQMYRMPVWIEVEDDEQDIRPDDEDSPSNVC